MKKLWLRINLTLGFFTTLPVKYVEWNEEDNKFMPILIPFVGMVIGGILYGLLYLNSLVVLSPVLVSILIVVYFIHITGGLHLDAFLDTCDAHFSRREKERKLEIMKDSNIGAFAAIFFMVLILIKFGVIFDIVLNNVSLTLLCIIPVISRLLQSYLLLNSKFAKDDGLAKMYGSIDKKYQWYFVIYLIVICVFAYFTDPVLVTIMFIVAVLYMRLYRYNVTKEFGGITGDIVGAYIEITEVLLLVTILVYTMIV